MSAYEELRNRVNAILPEQWGGALSGASLQLDISLSITESVTTNGYDFGMLIGAIHRPQAMQPRISHQLF